MNGGDKAIRWAAVLAVAAVAGVAGWVSYRHTWSVVASHGEGGAVGLAYPVTSDGLMLSASLALLDAARRKVPAPGLARWALAAGVAATIAANLLAGLRYGTLGAVVSLWPALALVGSFETLMLILRGGTSSQPAATPDRPPATVAADATEAARVALTASIAASNPLSQRQLADRFGLTRPAAAKLHREVVSSSNGHGG